MQEITLNSIDKLIGNAKKYNLSEEYLTELAKLIIPFLGIKSNTINSKSLINKELEQSKKRFISFCLLRVYSINSDILTDRSIKHHVHSFLEQSIPDIFKKLNINSKTETYVKESILTSFVKDKEKEFSSKLNSKIEIDFIKEYKANYLSVINQRLYSPILWQFFGDKINIQLFNNVFKLLEEYNKTDYKNKFELYNKAIKNLNILIDLSIEIKTKYSNEYITKPFSFIKEKVDNDYLNNPFSQPADLTISKTVKKYPFFKKIDYKIQLSIENNSTGYANDAKVMIELYSDDIITINQTEQYVGLIKTSSIVEFDYKGIKNSENILLYGYVEWTNINGKKSKNNFELTLLGQKTDINWNEIENEEPYDLEPVTNENEFVGRRKIISELKKIKTKVGSSYIYGQRRVGKTSIVKTLQSIIKSTDVLIMYIEAGDWDNATSPHKSMNDLGEIICNRIKRYDKKFNSLSIPNFDGSFNRLTNFLDEVSEIDKSFKVLIVLDEFDRISNKLLQSGDIASSFINTLRSISNREPFGFILVGGEKLEYILSQWQEFNKFKAIRVDYFDKKTEWDDFKDLIRFPIKNILEISDRAIDYIYNQTSGNPYFTKKICVELFSLMVRNRDSHVTENEARKATEIARDSSHIAATDFSHFWKDGIKEKEEKEEEISINRRKVLLSIGQLLKQNKNTSKQLIIDKSIANGLSELQSEKTLDEFIQRKILKIENNKYRFVVKFFEDWLINNGLYKIITTFQEEQRIILRDIYNESIIVKLEELNSLSKSWHTYKGKEVTTDNIREWLEQFDDIENQRTIFKLIKNIKFYSNIEIREKMEDLFKEVRRKINRANKEITKKDGQRKRDDIIVSYLDKNPAKSGAEYAKIFVEANNIYKDFSTNPDKLKQKITDLKNINSLVFIDDFIGTGNSIIENLEPIIIGNKKILKEKNILVIIGVITGYQNAKHKVIEFSKKHNFPLNLILLDPLDNSNKAFDTDSLIYPEPIKRENAKNICYKIGLQLEKKQPLGFGNCQATVVFPNSCPNNSIPIIWKETKDWKPLFKR